MITFTKLGEYGRLGNQMFQYAALLGVRERLGFEVAVPSSSHHELGQTFRITAPTLRWRDRRSLKYLVHDDRMGYRPVLETVRDRSDLLGYFQSPRHFPARQDLLEEFRLLARYEEPALERLAQLRTRTKVLVAMSVRRGDYLINDHFVSLSETGYYVRSLTEFSTDNALFVISSDDPTWCREQFVGPEFAFIDDLENAAQFGVLTGCDHAITANGTFSWWSAWLNESPGKRVIAPDVWMEPNDLYREEDRERPPHGWEERPSRIEAGSRTHA